MLHSVGLHRTLGHIKIEAPDRERRADINVAPTNLAPALFGGRAQLMWST